MPVAALLLKFVMEDSPLMLSVGHTGARVVSSSMTNFSNNACGSIVTYYPETENNAEKHTMLARFNIMRHTDHENVNLDLTDANGKNMAHINLADFLAANPVIDLTKHEALIPIRIEFKSIGAVITVPDWYIVDVKPEF